MTNWPTVPLSEVATIDRQVVNPKDISVGTEYVGLEHIERGGRLIGHEVIGDFQVASAKFRFSDSHVLYGKLRPYLAKIARPSKPGVCSTDILPVRPGPRLDRDFLTHFLRQPHMIEHASARAAGANLPRLSPTELAKFVIPVPPLDEQRRIAAILDQAIQQIKRSALAYATVRSLPSALFVGEFGDPAKATSTVSLGEVVARVTDGEHKTPPREKTGVPLLSARNVQDGHVSLEDVDFVAPDVFEQLAKRIRPRRGDVLISCSGTIGRVARVRDDSSFAMVRSVALVRPADELHPVFLEEQLRLPAMRRLMQTRANSSAQANLFQNQIRSLPILVPPRADQDAYAERLLRMGTLIDGMSRRQAVAQQHFVSLQARAFSGRL